MLKETVWLLNLSTFVFTIICANTLNAVQKLRTHQQKNV